MSEDLIKRSDTAEVVYKALKTPPPKGVLTDTMSLAIALVRDIPSADRPQGEWIDMGDFEKCSVCKGTHLKEFQSYYGKVTWMKTPFCPNCGAKMYKEKSDE